MEILNNKNGDSYTSYSLIRALGDLKVIEGIPRYIEILNDLLYNNLENHELLNFYKIKPSLISSSRVIKIFLSLLGTMAIFLFVYSGYLLITSHGESEKVTKARKIMTGAVIGMLLILLSFSITNFVGNKLQENINQTSN